MGDSSLPDSTLVDDDVRMSRWSSVVEVKTWTPEEVGVWGATIHVAEDSIQKLMKAKIDGPALLHLGRKSMDEIGITSELEQARILGHIDLLKDKRGDDEDDEDEPNDTPQDTVPVAPAGRRNTISHADASAAENLVLLKSRVWELFWDDAVASRTTRLFVEGDLTKYASNKMTGQTRRYLLLDTALLWCAVQKRGPTLAEDKITLKGRLDHGGYSIIDLPDNHPVSSKKKVSNAFKIYNQQKDKWYTLVAPDTAGKKAWMNAFVEAKVPIEKAKQFAPSTESATWRSDALMSNEDRMKIMMLVRDGHMTVEQAMQQASQTESDLQAQAQETRAAEAAAAAAAAASADATEDGAAVSGKKETDSSSSSSSSSDDESGTEGEGKKKKTKKHDKEPEANDDYTDVTSADDVTDDGGGASEYADTPADATEENAVTPTDAAEENTESTTATAVIVGTDAGDGTSAAGGGGDDVAATASTEDKDPGADDEADEPLL